MFSCSSNDDYSQDFYNEMLPIERANFPDQFQLGKTYEITLTYIRPSTCYGFNNIYNVQEANVQTLAIVANVAAQTDNCITLNEEMEASFNFTANHRGSYIFKLWQGEKNYLIIEVPVEE